MNRKNHPAEYSEHLFLHAPIGIIELNQNLEIQRINPYFQKITGHSEQALNGTSLRDHFPPDKQREFDKLFEKLSKKLPETIEFESNFFCNGNKIRPCTLTFIPTGEDKANPSSFIVTYKDTSKGIFFREELIRANTQKENLLDVLAHEIKNHLSQVSLSVFYMKKKLSEKLEEEDREFLEYNIINAVQKASKLISEISEGKKHSSALSLPEKKKFNLNLFLSEMENPLHKWAETKEMEFILEQPDYMVEVTWDPERIRKAIDNIISNAIRFSPRGSSIILSWEKKDKDVVLSIKDEGIGIPEHLLKEIFEKFTPVARPGTEDEKNNGIGLFITKRIIENHEGHIQIKSKENEGTEIQLILPV